jgi:hypothetical protein
VTALWILLHGRLSTILLWTGLAGAVWGAWAAWRRQPLSPDYVGLVLVAELSLITQAASGAWLLAAGRRPGQAVHVGYGLLVTLIWPAAWTCVRGRGERWASLICGLASLSIAALAARAALMV